jgi:broad specificity phosphatase PhoE
MLAAQHWLRGVRRIVSSTEHKALETAHMLAAALRLAVEPREGIGENDRSATGRLPPSEFQALADRFFAEPQHEVRGWESAVAAQARIVHGLADLLQPAAQGDVVVLGHGGVGTLWYCHLAGLPISRRHDQPSQGHYFQVDLASARPLHAWRPVDGTDY